MLGVAFGLTDNCDPDPLLGFCSSANDQYEATFIGLAIGSVVAGIASAVFERKAVRAASRSVFWHNASFAR